MKLPRSWRRPALGATVMLGWLAGCASPLDKSADFDRHRHSQLIQPVSRPGVIYFDVRFNPDFPADEPFADTARERWLATWLEIRGLCPAGYEVSRRRPFDYLEDNPRGYDQRWEIACRQ